MLIYIEVYRVNWLRARAQHNRWTEELALTEHEMEWTVRWYVHMAKQWKSRRDAGEPFSLGHMAYAERQMAMWNELGHVAQFSFTKSNPTNPAIWENVV